jgi:hypothetical protein
MTPDTAAHNAADPRCRNHIALSHFANPAWCWARCAICRACHYGHHNECEDDRCDCRH